jgi:hypothetical protein
MRTEPRRVERPAASEPVAAPPEAEPPPEQPRVRPFEWPVFQSEPEPEATSRTDMRSDIPPPRQVPIPEPPILQPPVVQRTAPPPPPAEERLQRAPRPTAPDPKEGRGSPGNFDLRPTMPVASNPLPASPLPKQPHSRWERPQPSKQPGRSASRFAPKKGTAPASAFDEDEDVDPFAEGGVFADRADLDDDDINLEAIADAPDFADDDSLPPFSDDPFEPVARRRGPSRNLLAVIGVLVVAVVGGVAFAMLRPSGAADGVPPIITANNAPTKITPDDSASAPADADAQNKLIYDRVNSAADNTETTLVTPNDGPIAPVGDDAANSNNPISRVIIPGGPGIDAPGTGDAAAADGGTAADDAALADDNGSASGDTAEPIGPRKVRTVVVKPDGTIVSSQAVDAGPAAAPATTAADGAAPPLADDAQPAAPVTDDTAAIAGNGSAELPITAVPPAAAARNVATTAPAVDPTADTETPALTVTPDPPLARTQAAAEAPPVKTAPVKPPANTVVASNDANGPLDLTQGAGGGGAVAQTTAASSGMLVQISSQKTEEAARATYKDLQRRYANILGPYDVNIQRADVPDRGTFFRVRVGPFSANDAQRLCDDLKAAGGDCVLARR